MLINSVILVTCLIFCYSCTSTQEDRYIYLDKASMYDCYNQREWNQQEIEAELIGRWQWQHYSCVGMGSQDVLNDELFIQFKPGNIVIVTERADTIQVGTWGLGMNEGYLTIQTNPYIEQLTGDIVFCEDRVLFSASEYDLCDHFFLQED